MRKSIALRQEIGSSFTSIDIQQFKKSRNVCAELVIGNQSAGFLFQNAHPAEAAQLLRALAETIEVTSMTTVQFSAQEILKSLDCLIDHVMHYATMQHAHPGAAKDAANARALVKAIGFNEGIKPAKSASVYVTES